MQLSPAASRTTTSIARVPANSSAPLARLPAEMHESIVEYLDEDDMAHLGSTNHYWQAVVAPYLYPKQMGEVRALQTGRRHLLGRLWQTPPDATHLTVGRRDTDGMTFLMHVATRGHDALLRCMLRHTRGPIRQTDHAGLRAVDWALLTGLIGPFREAAQKTSQEHAVGAHSKARLTLHTAVVAGHWQLFQRLLEPHYVHLNYDWPPVVREGYRLHERQPCGQTAIHCAGQHSPASQSFATKLSRLAHPVTAHVTEQQARDLAAYVRLHRTRR